ncbi:MAG: Ribosomal-protein-S18p-alanine acetyltransferase-related protein [Candidatus Ozemobacter sibiricus]|jgi:ribosomal protein S18 acetylase RimI-like enzyme|uniref:Ribosomal-protein-S18p-alanine acetyltransferase-related protein n=1 Tax=Candidatus Ozemobacter sibiricus TaxID=2268124 RepID=A0A367ZPS7_9BACT|nr:MAG: Ribosomal-protein-S18p-alanine acetyltransferase-related protein [Candidatus Ozemobacter sibiricus]
MAEADQTLIIERLPEPPTWSDLEAFAALDREAFAADGLTAANLRLLALTGRLYVARLEGQVTGQAVVLGRLDGPGAFLLGLAVGQAWRGRQMGRRLLQFILADLARAGVPFLELTVDPANLPAVSLYEKEGFVRERLVPDLLGPGKARLIMRRSLS